MAEETLIYELMLRANQPAKTIQDLIDRNKELVKGLKNIEDRSSESFKKVATVVKNSQAEITKFNQELRNSAPLATRISQGITSAFGKMGAAIVAAFAVQKVYSFFSAAYAGYEEQAKQERLLSYALDNRAIKTQRLLLYADKLRESTGVKDDVLVQMEAYLAKQGRTEAQIKKTMLAAINFSRVTEQDEMTTLKQLDGTFSGITGRMAKYEATIATTTLAERAHGKVIDIIAEKYAGVAEEMATTQEKLAASWDAAKEGIGKVISPVINEVLNAFNTLVSESSSRTEKLSTVMEEERLKVNNLAFSLKDSNTTQEKRKEIYDELVEIAPEVVAGMKDENDLTIDLTANLIKYNDQQIKKIAFQKLYEQSEEATAAAGEHSTVVYEKQYDVLNKLEAAATSHGVSLKELRASYEKTGDAATYISSAYKLVTKDMSTLSMDYMTLQNLMENYNKMLSGGVELNDAAAESLKRYNAIVKMAGYDISQVTDLTGDAKDMLYDYANMTEEALQTIVDAYDDYSEEGETTSKATAKQYAQEAQKELTRREKEKTKYEKLFAASLKLAKDTADKLVEVEKQKYTSLETLASQSGTEVSYEVQAKHEEELYNLKLESLQAQYAVYVQYGKENTIEATKILTEEFELEKTYYEKIETLKKTELTAQITDAQTRLSVLKKSKEVELQEIDLTFAKERQKYLDAGLTENEINEASLKKKLEITQKYDTALLDEANKTTELLLEGQYYLQRSSVTGNTTKDKQALLALERKFEMDKLLLKKAAAQSEYELLQKQLKESEAQGIVTTAADKALLQEKVTAYQEAESGIQDMIRETGDVQMAVTKETLEGISKVSTAIYSGLSDFASAVGESMTQSIDGQVAAIDKALEKSKSASDTLSEQLKVAHTRDVRMIMEKQEVQSQAEADLEAQKDAIEAKQHKREKDAALAKAVIDTALAILNIWASSSEYGLAGPAIAAVLTGIAVATMGAQIAAITNTVYEEGGQVKENSTMSSMFPSFTGGMIYGASHKKGGVKFKIGNQVHEAQGDEYIVNQKATKMFFPIIDYLNSLGRSSTKSSTFESGGITPTYSSGLMRTMFSNPSYTSELSGKLDQLIEATNQKQAIEFSILDLHREESKLDMITTEKKSLK